MGGVELRELRELRVVVCVKPVPAAEAVLDRETGGPDRRGPLSLDEVDGVGVEVALRLVAAGGGGSVTVLGMAPEGGAGALRRALAMGADRALLVSDPALAGSDALGSAKVLAAAIRREGFDLVVAGSESSDASAGVLPVQLAELLRLPAVTFARRVELDGDGLAVERVTPQGWEEVTAAVPCLLTVTPGAAQARFPSVTGVMKARSKPFVTLSLDDLGLEPGVVGWQGARVSVREVADPVPPKGDRVEGAEAGAERILALLDELGLP